MRYIFFIVFFFFNLIFFHFFLINKNKKKGFVMFYFTEIYLNVFTTTKITNFVSVKTDIFDIKIDLNGGDISSLYLLQHYEKNSDSYFSFFNNTTYRYYGLQSGVLRPSDSFSVFLHYTCEKDLFLLGKDENFLTIDLVCIDLDSIKIIKRYVLERNSYIIRVIFIVQNNSNNLFFGKSYYRLFRHFEERDTFYTVGSFNGLAVNSKNSLFKKISFKKLKKNIFQQINDKGWFAFVERYFISVWFPENFEDKYFVGEEIENNVFSCSCFEKVSFLVKPGEIIERYSKLYVGPINISNLRNFYPGLELSIDYGIFWPIAKLIFYALTKVNMFFNNWGYSIIIITIFIKILFYPLSYMSYKSMSKMKNIQPKLKELKTLYSNDKNKLTKEILVYYKKEKVNPLTGCLPMLLQIPIFISLYYVILEAVEFRNAYFIFWISDLSSYDPFFVLPILMGLTMFIQQKLSITEISDSFQQKLMFFLPFLFIFLFLKFSSGLVLYWIINNTVSIIQQWFILRQKKC